MLDLLSPVSLAGGAGGKTISGNVLLFLYTAVVSVIGFVLLLFYAIATVFQLYLATDLMC